MEVTVTFKGVARPSMDPQFVDMCLGPVNERRWGDVGPITLHIFPAHPGLYATLAWRGEVFAYAFPSKVTGCIHLGQSSKDEESHVCYDDSESVKALATLLDQYLQEQMKRRERWLKKATEDLTAIHAMY